MYTKPDYEKGSVVDTVPGSTQVDILTIMADVPWAEISYDGEIGYIALESLSINRSKGKDSESIAGTPATTTERVTQTMYVTSPDGHSARLYSEPMPVDRNLIMDVPYGQTVKAITIMADIPWAKIDYDGRVGYMLIDHLSKTKPINEGSPHAARP